MNANEKNRCILIFPRFYNIDVINNIRRKFDPVCDCVAPHITLVFPFTSKIPSAVIKEHLENVLRDIKPFKLVMQGVSKVNRNGNFLFLEVKECDLCLQELYNKLYTGILEQFKPPWLKATDYHPHVTLGSFKSDEALNTAYDEVLSMNDVFETIVGTISVEIIAENNDSIIESEVILEG